MWLFFRVHFCTFNLSSLAFTSELTERRHTFTRFVDTSFKALAAPDQYRIKTM